jgi:hypothetical protein
MRWRRILERWWTDNLPAVALAHVIGFGPIERQYWPHQQFLEEPVSAPVFFHACATPRGMKAQAPGPPTVMSSPTLNVISPFSA